MLRHLAKAARHLGELNGPCASLPDPQFLINTIVLQESRDSLAIENIVTTQDELYKAATEETTTNVAAKEVLSYREALYIGFNNMMAQKNPGKNTPAGTATKKCVIYKLSGSATGCLSPAFAYPCNQLLWLLPHSFQKTAACL